MHFGPFVRLFLIALPLAAPFASGPARAADPAFPYEAIVTRDGAVVHSGNGEKYYATNRLEPGARVRVHRHDPDGWRMIAPPAGSFSLIPADSIEPLQGDLAEIVSEDICVRVGSAIVEDYGVEQVPLRIGTQVELLPGQSAPPGWTAIRPPHGEYRWMRADDLRPAQQESANVQEPGDPSSEMNESENLFDSMRELDQQLQGLENENPAQWPLEALSLGYQRLKRSQLELAQQIDARLARITELNAVRDNYLANGETADTSPNESEAADMSMPFAEGLLTSEEPSRETFRPVPQVRNDDHADPATQPVDSDSLPPSSEKYYPTNIATLPRGDQPTTALNHQSATNYDEPQMPEGAGRPVAELAPAGEPAAPPATSPDTPTATPANPIVANSPPVGTSASGPMPPAGTPGAMPAPGEAAPRRFDAVGYIQKAVDPPPNAPAYVLVSREGRILAYLQEPANTSFEPYLGRPMGVDGTPRNMPGMQLPMIAVERLTPVRFP